MPEHPDMRPDMYRPGDDAEAVPADLTSLHRRLVADGQVWRRRLPAAQGVIRRTHELTARSSSPTPLASQERPSGTWHSTAGATNRDPSTRATSTYPLKGQPTMMTGRLRGIATGAAAIAVVALLALLLHAFAAGRSGPGTTGQGIGVPGRTPGTQGGWQTIAGLTFTTTQNDMSALPAVAPSDPNTVYQATLSPVTLRRTADAGAHWTTLHLPGDTSHVEDFQVFVSPLDATHVFVTLTSSLPPQSQPSACPTLTGLQQGQPAALASTGATSGASPDRGMRASRPRSGTIPCSIQYFSADGGDSWQQLTLPVRGVLVNPSPALAAPSLRLLQAQGNHLFAAEGCGPFCEGPSLDIVTSADGGAHWTLADRAIRSAGSDVCDFGVSPSGGDIFAITATQGCSDMTAVPSYLWHSTDGGGHWTRVGRLPADAWLGLAVVPQPQGQGQTQPLLYIHLPQVTVQGHGTSMSDGPTSLKVSADGGKTWKAAPPTGITTTTRPYSGPLCVLGDGTVVEDYGDPGSVNTLYGWKLGEAGWQPVAPAIRGQVMQVLVEGQGGSQSLVAVTITGYQQSGQSISGETITVQSYTATE